MVASKEKHVGFLVRSRAQAQYCRPVEHLAHRAFLDVTAQQKGHEADGALVVGRGGRVHDDLAILELPQSIFRRFGKISFLGPVSDAEKESIDRTPVLG